MNVYDYMDLFAVAVRDNTAVKDYCIANFDKGLLVQIDDDNEDPIDSGRAPYCVMMSIPGADDSPVAEVSLANIRVEVGTTPTGEPPYSSVTTARTATANGITKFNQGNKAADLLDLILDAMKATSLQEDTLLESSSIDANGSLYFPLALAVSTVSVTAAKTLNTFS